MVAPPVTDLHQEISDFLSEALTQVDRRGIAAVGQEVETVARQVLTVGAEIASSEGGVVAEVVTADVAGMTLRVFGLPLYLGVFAGLLLTHWMIKSIRGSLGHIPWVGGKLTAAWDIVTAPDELLYQWVVQSTIDQIAGLFGAIIALVHWATSAGWNAPDAATKHILGDMLSPLQHRLETVEAENAVLRREYLDLAQEVHAGTAPPASGGTNTGGRVAQLEKTLHEVQVQIGALSAANAVQNGQLTVLTHDVAQLRTAIYGARAASVGFQDVVHEIEQLQTTLGHTQASLAAQLATHTAELTHLAPLASLLYLGERGLENLRTLERDMCQCPRLPGIHPLQLDALALYEFVTNG